jgi:peptidoglycan/xylan/chitin deacetylase (PgdA/CDA1 family)
LISNENRLGRGGKLKEAAITIDVETDWGGRLSVAPGNCHGIEDGILYLLHLLDELKIKATFFISGEVVLEYTDIIRNIVEHGHEIASHGFKHNVDYSTMSKMEINEQISKSKKILKDDIGVTPIGFRAPQCRTNDHLFDMLSDLGFKYDSSMVRGFLPTRYNNRGIPSEPFIKNNLLEIPISTMPYLKVPMGLLWINAMGFSTFRFLSERITFTDTIVLYLHPFDLIEAKSKKDFGFIINRWYNLRSNKVKCTLESLLKYWKGDREFVLLKDVAEAEQLKILEV